MELADAIVATSEITNSNGTFCSELLSIFAANDDFDVCKAAHMHFVLLHICMCVYIYMVYTVGARKGMFCNIVQHNITV